MARATELSRCMCCRTNSVGWPRVCDECTDHEAQAELASYYGLESYEDPDGNLIAVTGMECKSCGMLYDGGMRCTYCGDPDPLDW